MLCKERKYQCHDLLITFDAHAAECDADRDVLREYIVLEIQFPLFLQHVASTLSLGCGAGYVHLPFNSILKNTYNDRSIVVDIAENSVFAHLLAREKHLLIALYDEVTARIVETLLHGGEFGGAFVAENALARMEHNGDLTDPHLLANNLISQSIDDVCENGS